MESKEIADSTTKTGMFKKLRALACHHCPMCRHARNNPDSTIGKILHHPLHADHCPMWKAEKEVYPETEGPSADPIDTNHG